MSPWGARSRGASELKGKLTYIKSHFVSISPAIAHFRIKGMALVDSVALLKKIEVDMDSGLGEVGKMVASKLKRVLEKNAGFNKLCRISKVLSGDVLDTSDIKQELTPNNLVYLKYAPIVSSDVESSFCMYKSILADNGWSFTFDHLRMFTVIYCNAE
ncbi:hypothetical protein ANN_09694 [Periplaneta americana]|uniref:Uncharacterized protein n=1 Tax=Periplaneta americana TaxID=6978 RepID=A0ABQ8TM02_PERAM|nr:hypothetical protein ANN_09694 [Periplaneta americana]